MQVKQAATILNEVLIPEFIGEEHGTVTEDLSNFVDFGRAFSDMATSSDFEKFHKKICDKVGKQIFVDRVYNGVNMNILRDGSEWGSVVEKTRFVPNDFEENVVWSLTNGQKYDDFLTFRATDAKVTYWNSKITYKISLDKPYNQVKSAMTSASAYMKYINALEVNIKNRKTVAFKALTQRVHNAMAAKRIAQGHVIDLLTEYNTKFDKELTPEPAMYDKEFLAYAISRIADISALMSELSQLYNSGGIATFSPKEYQTLALNSLFSANINTFLKANTYHPEFLNEVKREEIPFWQSTGDEEGASISARTAINVKISDNILEEGDTTVSRDFVIGTLRDRDSIAIFNNDEYALSFQNPDNGVTKTNYMTDLSLFADPAENFVVFVLGSGS